MIEVFVESIRVNMTNYKRVVMLKDKTAQRYLPIWIGHFEADAIAIPMQNVPTKRPLTHDMLIATIGQLGGRCTSAVISRLENETFYAILVADQGGRSVEIDCRPSDAISAAIRAKVPIFVPDELMDRAGMVFEDGRSAPTGESTTSNVVAEAEGVTDAATSESYWPGAEPGAGPAPKPFDTLTNVSEPVLGALHWALADATRRRRPVITSVDLMLGLLRQERGAASRVLASLSVEPAELRTLDRQGASQDVSPPVLTEGALSILRRAVDEADRLDEDTVRSEHLLLALAGETDQSVPAAFDKIGLTVAAIRRQVAVLLAQAATSDAPPHETPPDDEGATA